ncbi:MAG: hypothetical protein U0556_06995 [Dehalococcoidia bacterium]
MNGAPFRREGAGDGEDEGVTEALAQEEQTTREALAAAVAAAYRRVVLDADHAAPPDLVAGETVAEIDASLERARAVVAQVRRKRDRGGDSTRGAGGRVGPDGSRSGRAVGAGKVRYRPGR